MRTKRLILFTTLGLAGTVSVLAAIGIFTGGGSAGDAHSTVGEAANLPSFAALPGDASNSATKSIAGGVPARTDSLTQDAKPAQPATTTSSGAGGGTTGTGGSLPGFLDRKVILNASLAMNVNDVSAAFDEASRLVRGSGGYVEKSSFIASSLGVSQKAATLTLRVPADQYDQLLGQLRTIQGAKVTSEGSKSTEVTEQYTDLQSRQRNLERTEQSYLKLLDQAKTIPDILSLNDRLDSVRGQIEQIQGRLNVLDHMTDLATIDVTLSPIVPGKSGPTTGPKPVGQAFADAWQWSLDAVRYAAATGAVGLVAVAWLVVPLGLVALGVRRMRRHGEPVSTTPVTSA